MENEKKLLDEKICRNFILNSKVIKMPRSADGTDKALDFKEKEIKSLTKELVKTLYEERNNKKAKILLKRLNYSTPIDVSYRFRESIPIANILFVIGFIILSVVCFLAGIYALRIKIEILKNILIYIASFVFFLPIYLLAYFSPLTIYKISMGASALLENILYIIFTNSFIAEEMLIEIRKYGFATFIILLIGILFICIPAIAFGGGYFYLLWKKNF